MTRGFLSAQMEVAEYYRTQVETPDGPKTFHTMKIRYGPGLENGNELDVITNVVKYTCNGTVHVSPGDSIICRHTDSHPCHIPEVN